MAVRGSGPVMEIAREISEILRETGIDGAVIGGVAVVLHGHTRTTVDVDVFAPEPQNLATVLEESGFVFDHKRREFVKQRVAVHLISPAKIGIIPKRRMNIDGVRTVSLADLLNIKLHSGQETMLRAKDLSDVIDLIRLHQLGKDFTPRIDKSLRSEFRKFVDAIQKERRQRKAGEGEESKFYN